MRIFKYFTFLFLVFAHFVSLNADVVVSGLRVIEEAAELEKIVLKARQSNADDVKHKKAVLAIKLSLDGTVPKEISPISKAGSAGKDLYYSYSEVPGFRIEAEVSSLTSAGRLRVYNSDGALKVGLDSSSMLESLYYSSGDSLYILFLREVSISEALLSTSTSTEAKVAALGDSGGAAGASGSGGETQNGNSVEPQPGTAGQFTDVRGSEKAELALSRPKHEGMDGYRIAVWKYVAVVSFMLVLLFLLYVLRNRLRGSHGSHIVIDHAKPLDSKNKIVVFSYKGRSYVVGVSNSSVVLIDKISAEDDLSELDSKGLSDVPESFTSLLKDKLQ